jgi:DNA-binding NarL/FixJ family response regulator
MFRKWRSSVRTLRGVLVALRLFRSSTPSTADRAEPAVSPSVSGDRDGKSRDSLAAVIIADRSDIGRRGVSAILADRFDIGRMIETRTLAETIAALKGELAVTLVVLDWALGPGLAPLAAVAGRLAETPLVVVGPEMVKPGVTESQLFGKAVFISRQAPATAVHGAVLMALGGEARAPATPSAEGAAAVEEEKGLNPLEHRLLRLLSDGCSDKEIAARTTLSVSTIRCYNSRLFRKLGVRTRVQAAQFVWSLDAEKR